MRRKAIIGGTGFGASLIAGKAETIPTIYGDALVTRADLGDGLELIFLARHGTGHTLPPHKINHRANIAALKSLEVEAVFATTAVGSLQKEIAPGDFVLLADFLDLTKGEAQACRSILAEPTYAFPDRATKHPPKSVSTPAGERMWWV
jgi:5'-methylthioadenosine phosphorylase